MIWASLLYTLNKLNVFLSWVSYISINKTCICPMAFSRDMFYGKYKFIFCMFPAGHLLLDHCWVNIWPGNENLLILSKIQFSAANNYASRPLDKETYRPRTGTRPRSRAGCLFLSGFLWVWISCEENNVLTDCFHSFYVKHS